MHVPGVMGGGTGELVEINVHSSKAEHLKICFG